MKENEGLRFLCSKAEVIDEIESTVPEWVKKRNPGWYPAFVHVLKVVPSWYPSLGICAMHAPEKGPVGETPCKPFRVA